MFAFVLYYDLRQSTSSTCSTSSKASSASSLTTSSTSSDDEQPISSSRGSSKRSRKRQRRELEIQKWLTHYNFQAVDIPRPLSRFTSEQEMVYPVHVAAIATYLVIVSRFSLPAYRVMSKLARLPSFEGKRHHPFSFETALSI